VTVVVAYCAAGAHGLAVRGKSWHPSRMLQKSPRLSLGPLAPLLAEGLSSRRSQVIAGGVAALLVVGVLGITTRRGRCLPPC